MMPTPASPPRIMATVRQGISSLLKKRSISAQKTGEVEISSVTLLAYSPGPQCRVSKRHRHVRVTPPPPRRSTLVMQAGVRQQLLHCDPAA
jgi:hypothetical protein